jgi:hypothetical protein
MLACIRRFANLENLLNHLETIDYCKTSERIDLELTIKGEIDQGDVVRLGGVHPYDSFEKTNPLNGRAGCYGRSFTILMKSGERRTFRYNGSGHVSRCVIAAGDETRGTDDGPVFSPHRKGYARTSPPLVFAIESTPTRASTSNGKRFRTGQPTTPLSKPFSKHEARLPLTASQAGP